MEDNKEVLEKTGNLQVEGGEIEEVESFCYLGEMFECEQGAEGAVRYRVAAAWNQWRDFVRLLINRGIPLRIRVDVFCSCVRPVLLYGAETWALTGRLEGLLRSCDYRMLRHMLGVRWQDRVTNEEVLRKCSVYDIVSEVRRRRLRWFGHVRRREDGNILRRAMEMEIPGKRPPGRPMRKWEESVKDDLKCLNIEEESVRDREVWKKLIGRPTPRKGRFRDVKRK